MSKELLEIKDLHVNAGEKEILKGLKQPEAGGFSFACACEC